MKHNIIEYNVSNVIWFPSTCFLSHIFSNLRLFTKYQEFRFWSCRDFLQYSNNLATLTLKIFVLQVCCDIKDVLHDLMVLQMFTSQEFYFFLTRVSLDLSKSSSWMFNMSVPAFKYTRFCDWAIWNKTQHSYIHDTSN